MLHNRSQKKKNKAEKILSEGRESKRIALVQQIFHSDKQKKDLFATLSAKYCHITSKDLIISFSSTYTENETRFKQV